MRTNRATRPFAHLERERETLVTTELAVAEADYLILDRLGLDVELAFLDDLAEGTFVVECLDRSQLRAARDVVARYRDLQLGLAAASLVVIAERYATRRLLTFHERAFRAVPPCRRKLHDPAGGSAHLALSVGLRPNVVPRPRSSWRPPPRPSRRARHVPVRP
jgi:hypothetical protein